MCKKKQFKMNMIEMMVVLLVLQQLIADFMLRSFFVYFQNYLTLIGLMGLYYINSNYKS